MPSTLLSVLAVHTFSRDKNEHPSAVAPPHPKAPCVSISNLLYAVGDIKVLSGYELGRNKTTSPQLLYLDDRNLVMVSSSVLFEY